MSNFRVALIALFSSLAGYSLAMWQAWPDESMLRHLRVADMLVTSKDESIRQCEGYINQVLETRAQCEAGDTSYQRADADIDEMIWIIGNCTLESVDPRCEPLTSVKVRSE